MRFFLICGMARFERRDAGGWTWKRDLNFKVSSDPFRAIQSPFRKRRAGNPVSSGVRRQRCRAETLVGRRPGTDQPLSLAVLLDALQRPDDQPPPGGDAT